MDIVLEAVDRYVFDALYATILPAAAPRLNANATSSFGEIPTAYPSSTWQYKPASQFISFPPTEAAYRSQWSRDDWQRQLISLYLITWLFGILIYYVFATFSYVFIFDKDTFNHPKYLKNQIKLEMRQTHAALPIMAIMTAPIFLAEVRGYSKLYDTSDEGPGRWYDFAQYPIFIFFTDFLIYWIHRGLHHRSIYKFIHKPHHKWIMPTPYASHAFHPLDGFAQGLPYHMYAFMFPVSKVAYVLLFIFVNIWTVMIHDGEYMANGPVINGAACHTLHHLYFNFNYGQFTTLWDRLGGSYRKPEDEMFQKELKMCKTVWNKQIQEMEKVVKEVEGVDDRSYSPEEPKKDI